jgi:hypothetical protein
MILQIIEWMLGTTGRALLSFIKDNTIIFNLVAGIYLTLLGLGHFQLWQIKKKTESLVIEISLPLVSNNPEITIQEIYNRIFPVWNSKIESWALFIPHRLEFYPVKATQDNIKQKFDFSQEWLKLLLISKEIIKIDKQDKTRKNERKQKK